MCSAKKALSLRINNCKKETQPLGTAQIKQKRSATLTVVGWNDNMAVYIASCKSSEPKSFIWHWNRFERRYIQEQQPN